MHENLVLWSTAKIASCKEEAQLKTHAENNMQILDTNLQVE